jgi:alkanesulfonate monooxygenase SsuD/methylene tetrahydromethanopterin reductase-like flavin-dependent oxidoreductase (luciferase family)
LVDNNASRARNSHDVRMRFSINIPNFGDFADPRTVATVAAEAEQAGWDALFVWDHVVHDKGKRSGQPFGDPWMLLTAAALVTSHLRLGTMVTPIARRRPEQLARQVATLDSLSGGRVIFCAGLGGPVEDEFGSFGDTTDPVVLAERLDEGLELLRRYWSGERVNHQGRHYHVRDVTLLPRRYNARDRRSGLEDSGHTADPCAVRHAGTAPFRCSPQPDTGTSHRWTRSVT